MQKNTIISMDRRRFLSGTASAGLLLAAGGGLLSPTAFAQIPKPKKGGLLRMGIGGGSSTDSFDPRILNDEVPVNLSFMLMNGLIEVDSQGAAIAELFDHWEADQDAKTWIFHLRQGVEFHNGKTLTVDDLLYSLNLHRGNTTSGARTVAAELSEVEKISDQQIRIRLDSPNADLPFVLSDYHFLVVPENFNDFSKPIGTGPFILTAYQPGVRAHFKRNPNYWRKTGPFVDEVEVIVINDIAARTNALISGEVDVMNKLDYKTVDLLGRNPALNIIRSRGGQHFPFPMNCGATPFNDLHVREAIKYGVDREQLLQTAFRGFGQLGNDHPIPHAHPFFNSELAQRPYDPEKAKFHLKKAGLSELNIALSSSEVVFPGAVDAAAIVRVAAAKAGINISIKREPADGYWDNVWMKAPFCMSYRGGRATVDQALSIAYAADSAQNDTYWYNEHFDKRLKQARGTLDEATRREIYYELQALVSNEGGALIPVFVDYLDAASAKVQGITTHPLFDMMGFRMAERVWLD